jgi:hypothetical protein
MRKASLGVKKDCSVLVIRYKVGGAEVQEARRGCHRKAAS